jgi:hypothetical protein
MCISEYLSSTTLLMYQHISMKCMHILTVTRSNQSARSVSLLAYILHFVYHPATQHIHNDPINTHLNITASNTTYVDFKHR